MFLNDFTNKAVLVTGGTKGLGLACGLAFGERGAHLYLTHRWGSADEAAIVKKFNEVGAAGVTIIEADASSDEETESLLNKIRERHDRVDVFISNVSFAQVGGDIDSYKRRSFQQSLKYSAWPMVGYVQQIKQLFGHYPRYTIGTSCDGPERYYPGYDFVAASKAVMETFCRYMAKHMWEEERARINILRSRPVATESLVATFGTDFEPFLKKYYNDDYFIEVEAVGRTALMMCSGLLDAMTGQVILLDKGVAFHDNLMRQFEHREEYGLSPF